MAKTISFRRISCQEALNSPRWPQIQAAYEDECRYPDLPADLDVDAYCALEASGAFHAIGAFDGAELVGFATYILYSIPHFKGRRLASCESIWLDRAYRVRGNGMRLIDEMMRLAKEDGAYGIYLGAKVGTAAERAYSHVATPMNILFWRKL